MGVAHVGHPAGIMPRDTEALTTPGASRWCSFVNSSGVDTGQVQRRTLIYNGTGGALVVGGVYMITYSGAEATMLQCIACADMSAVPVEICVALTAAANATWSEMVTAGYCYALVDGDSSDVTDEDWLKIVAGTNADAFILDHATTRSTDSVAKACEANASTEALKKVYVLGGDHLVS